jgi:hypothetical protein
LIAAGPSDARDTLPDAMSSSPTHRICLQSWELLQTFRGSLIPREGEMVLLEKDGREAKYRVTGVLYKIASGGELVATVFVAP